MATSMADCDTSSAHSKFAVNWLALTVRIPAPKSNSPNLTRFWATPGGAATLRARVHWRLAVEIFAPFAASRKLGQAQIEQLEELRQRLAPSSARAATPSPQSH
jgi:hypothetical protein